MLKKVLVTLGLLFLLILSGKATETIVPRLSPLPATIQGQKNFTKRGMVFPSVTQKRIQWNGRREKLEYNPSARRMGDARIRS